MAAWHRPPSRSGVAPVAGGQRRLERRGRRGCRRRRGRQPGMRFEAAPEKADERDERARGRAERRWADTRSNGCRRQRDRHRRRRNASADDGTHAHNTLSAGNTNVQVFYPFHPLRGATLEILRNPKRGDGAVCVMDPAGRRLKIPVWMLLPECTEIRISQRPHLSKEALLSLASLIASQLDSKDPVHDNLLQTTVNGCEGDRRGATSISGPDDPK